MQAAYFAMLAQYNGWANRQLYEACEALSVTEYMRERPSFFGSLHATLNHVLVADRIWLARIEGQTPAEPEPRSDPLRRSDWSQGSAAGRRRAHPHHGRRPHQRSARPDARIP